MADLTNKDASLLLDMLLAARDASVFVAGMDEAAFRGFQGGQPTNCRVNAAILVESLRGCRIDLWFATFDGTRDAQLVAETTLIHKLNPTWNRAKRPLTFS
jgi:hypothetical protein